MHCMYYQLKRFLPGRESDWVCLGFGIAPFLGPFYLLCVLLVHDSSVLIDVIGGILIIVVTILPRLSIIGLCVALSPCPCVNDQDSEFDQYAGLGNIVANTYLTGVIINTVLYITFFILACVHHPPNSYPFITWTFCFCFQLIMYVITSICIFLKRLFRDQKKHDLERLKGKVQKRIIKSFVNDFTMTSKALYHNYKQHIYYDVSDASSLATFVTLTRFVLITLPRPPDSLLRKLDKLFTSLRPSLRNKAYSLIDDKLFLTQFTYKELPECERLLAVVEGVYEPDRLSLAETCRHVIRQAAHVNVFYTAARLELPEKYRPYLVYGYYLPDIKTSPASISIQYAVSEEYLDRTDKGHAAITYGGGGGKGGAAAAGDNPDQPPGNPAAAHEGKKQHGFCAQIQEFVIKTKIQVSDKAGYGYVTVETVEGESFRLP